MRLYTGKLFALVAASFGAVGASASMQNLPLYRDANQPVERRVEDLLSRMTLEEKAGQMSQFVGPGELRRQAQRLKPEADPESATGFYPHTSVADVRRLIREGRVGSILNVAAKAEIEELQVLAAQSRLGIPLLIGADAIHGNGLVAGSTIYPTPLALAATFDDILVEKVARQTALEMRAHGSHWTFSPNVEVARDPRWGRAGESFGEDTLLVGRLGAAMVRGYQNAAQGKRVLSCLKHLLGGGAPMNGLNFAPMDVSERTLRTVYLPPYLEGVKAGAASLMAAHHELNGIPCHANEWIMQTLMRAEAGFSGFIVSDWTDVARLATVHRVAENFPEAVRQTVAAGLDLNMHGPEFGPALVDLVRTDRLAESRIDESVRRILRAKFTLGLFELSGSTIADEAVATDQVDHWKTALEAARKSIVLLKNEGELLPLKLGKARRVLVTGPLADSTAVVGDWVFPQPPENIVTIWEGLRQVSPPGVQLQLAELGNTVRSTPPEKIVAAVAAGQQADVIVAVVGEKATRYNDGGDLKTSGENADRSDIELFPDQLDLLRRLHATGKPLVVVLVNSRPLAIEWLAENVSAIVQAWEPGGRGGQAVAEVLWGEINPSGKLPMSVSRGAGHIQAFYNHKPSQYYRKYVLGESGVRYPFGHGLSYSKFTYRNLSVQSEIAVGKPINLTVEVTNIGSRAGEEVVLAFVNDVVASVAVPVRELKAYQRIALESGETKKIALTISPEQLALFDRSMRAVVEPGDFDLFVGDQKTRFKVIH